MGFRERAPVVAALLLVLARFWWQPLDSSYWIDEAGTLFWARGSFADLIENSRWIPAPPAYPLLMWFWVRLAGFSEAAVRLPSILFMLASAWVLHGILRRRAGEQGAWGAAVLFLGTALLAFFAVDARPYAMALFLCMLATHRLLRWMEENRGRDAVLYGVLLSALLLTHWFHAMVLGITHALVRLVAGRRTAWQIAVAASIPIAAGISEGLRLRGPAFTGANHYLGPPGWEGMAAVFLPLSLTAQILAGLAVGLSAGRAGGYRIPGDRRLRMFLVTWWLMPALLLACVTLATGADLTPLRYRLPSVAGAAAGAGLLLSGFAAARARAAALTAALLLMLAASIYRDGPVLPHSEENWRSAMAAAQQSLLAQRGPILVQAGFSEGAHPKWFEPGPRPAYLMSALAAYPVEAATGRWPLPYSLNQALEPYLEELVERLRAESRFVIVQYVGPPGGPRYAPLFAQRMAGLRARSLGRFGRVEAILMER